MSVTRYENGGVDGLLNGMDEVPKNVSPMIELGATGLRRTAGYISEEFLPQLKGRKAVQVYREMSDNDPVIGALLFSVDRLLREIDWRVEPASSKPEDKQAAEFIEQCMEDMSSTWDDVISEILTMLPFGWSWHEVVYKKRIGPWEKNPQHRSKYTDGKIGWRKIPIRAQETLMRWVFDDTGGIKAMIQMAPPAYKMVTIPIEKSLLFRVSTAKGNPEGRAESPDNTIWTPQGERRFGDLMVGDQVYSANGEPTTVLAVRRWQERPRYRVTVDSGEVGIYDANHLWKATSARQRYNDAAPRKPLKTTEQIAASFDLGPVSRINGIQTADPVAAPEATLPVDPYVLGYWLGNGSKCNGQISCRADDMDEIRSLIEDAGYAAKGKTAGGKRGLIGVIKLMKPLRDLGVLNDKHVPARYLSASIRQRSLLLAGLLDSDGHGDEFGRVEFSNTNKALVDAVAHLVRSLGMKAFVTLSRPAIPEKNWQPVWDVKFTPTSPVFRLARKNAAISADHQRVGTHFITSIERVEDGPTMCIEVDSEDHLYLTGPLMVPTHNSFLRNAYRPWYMKKRLEELEGIGAERDLAGLPMARVPSDYLSAAKGTDKEKMVTAFRTMVRSVRRNEQEGIIIPRMMDPDTKTDMFDFSLLGGGGTRQFDINGIIERYETRMLMTVLADFIIVGHEQVGSYALHSDKSGLFRSGIQSIANSIADVFNRYAIPRLFEVNGWKLDELPQLVAGDIDPPDLTQLSSFMGQLQSAGIQWFPDPELEKFLREAARLPKLDETTEEVKETEARQASIMRLAQQRLDMLGMSQQAEQGAMQMEQTKQQLAQGEMQMQQGQEQVNPEVQAAQDTQTVQSGEMDLAAKEQQMRHAEEKHGLTLEQMKAQMQAKQSAEDPRFADQKLKQGDDLHKEKVGQMKFQTKAQQELHAEKVKQMRLKAKVPAKKTPPQAKEKK